MEAAYGRDESDVHTVFLYTPTHFMARTEQYMRIKFLVKICGWNWTKPCTPKNVTMRAHKNVPNQHTVAFFLSKVVNSVYTYMYVTEAYEQQTVQGCKDSAVAHSRGPTSFSPTLVDFKA